MQRARHSCKVSRLVVRSISHMRVPGLLSRSGNLVVISLFQFVFVACLALDCTRAAFASGKSGCETLSFLSKHSWVFRVVCWVVVARCLAGLVVWAVFCSAGVWSGCLLSSLFLASGSLQRRLDLSSLCFLNLPKGGNYRQFFIGVCTLSG